MAKKSPKIEFNKLKSGMRVFLDFPHVEQTLQDEAEMIADGIMLSKPLSDGRNIIDILVDYLDAGAKTEERLKVLIGLSGGSLEKFKRIYEHIFQSVSWHEMQHQAEIRYKIANLLINPDKEIAQIPQFIRQGFYLPQNWVELLQDKKYLRTVVSQKMLQAKYAVSVGNALENEIRKIVTDSGHKHQKGKVRIVDNKEVDVAIPNTEVPQILIMSSYQLTTSSGQSSKANEQARMYTDILTENRRRRMTSRHSTQIKFINIIDGGGWIARENDLYKMWNECDYCFAHSQLAQLEEVIK